MTAFSFIRGHQIYYDSNDEVWKYVDNNKLINEFRECTRCGKKPTPEGHDACLGKLKGVESACCGHGITDRYASNGDKIWH